MRAERRRAAVSGAILLEALVALATFAIVATAVTGAVAESLRAVSSVHRLEAGYEAAHRLLTAVSLWPRADLDRRMGSTRQGPWALRIDRLEAVTYFVSVTDTIDGAVRLETALFREWIDQ